MTLRRSHFLLPALLTVWAFTLQLSPVAAQDQHKAHAYKLPVPEKWTTEEFALPPDFAAGFTWKGVEDIRFHSGWGDSTSAGYWSYAYLWWLDGQVTPDVQALQHNLRAYYDGLVGRNIDRRKIPADKVIATAVTLRKGKATGSSKAVFTGTIRMLDYMTQKPMTLQVVIQVKESGTPGRSAVLVAVSPQQPTHAVWKELEAVTNGFAPAAP